MIKRIALVTLMFLDLMLEKYEEGSCSMEELHKIALPKIIFLRDCSGYLFRYKYLVDSIKLTMIKYAELDERFII